MSFPNFNIVNFEIDMCFSKIFTLRYILKIFKNFK